MRFFHTADIHLGAAPDMGFPWGKERASEIWESFRNLIREAEREQIDLLLIAGDLFHRQPLLRELKEVNYLFSTLTRTKVVFVIGNHDYLKRDSYYRGFEWNKNVVCLQEANCQKVVFRELQTAVYGLSYLTREIREPLYDTLAPEEDGLCSILLAHGGDEKHIPMDKRKLLLSGFDYIALGHIHKPQVIEKNRMIYPGSLEPLDKTETGPHGFISGTYKNGRLDTRFVPFAVREYIPVTITVDESQTDFSLQEKVKAVIREKGDQNIYRIAIKGFRDPDISFQMENYRKLGNVVEAEDDSEPSYDFEKLLRQHERDLIGCYIEKLYHPQMSETKRKALCYGIQALLGGKG